MTGLKKIAWSGEIAPQKWMNFYTKVLSRFVTGSGLRLTVRVEVAPEGGISKQKVDEAKSALRELGLSEGGLKTSHGSRMPRLQKNAIMKDLHIALKSEVVEKSHASGVDYVLARLQHGKTDVSYSLHAYPMSYTSSELNPIRLLQHLGFQESKCPFFSSGRCLGYEVQEGFDAKEFGDAFGRSLAALSDANGHFKECGLYIVNDAGPDFATKTISWDGHNCPTKRHIKSLDDDVFHYVLTWVEGRDKGWVIHYRPQHPPLTDDMEAGVKFPGVLQQFSECPEYNFEECYWRFMKFEAGSGGFGRNNADLMNKCYEAHTRNFPLGLQKLLVAQAELSAYGMHIFPPSPKRVEQDYSEPPQASHQRNRKLIKYKYDVALSFAGSERALAEQLAKMLKDRGIAVFYDGFYPEHLWGKDLTVEFDKIYRNEARYCVIFVSSEYANGMWTIHERRSALARFLAERGKEYILPIKVADAELDGLAPSIGYLDITAYPIPQIAEILISRLYATYAANRNLKLEAQFASELHNNAKRKPDIDQPVADIEHCPNCGGALKIIAAIEDPPVIVRILIHLGLPTRAPPHAPAPRFDLFQTA